MNRLLLLIPVFLFGSYIASAQKKRKVMPLITVGNIRNASASIRQVADSPVLVVHDSNYHIESYDITIAFKDKTKTAWVAKAQGPKIPGGMVRQLQQLDKKVKGTIHIDDIVLKRGDTILYARPLHIGFEQ